MTPETLRALADTVAWQDRTDLHEPLLGAADEIERLKKIEAEFVRLAANFGKTVVGAVREDLVLKPVAIDVGVKE